jgi:hypothetical protein
LRLYNGQSDEHSEGSAVASSYRHLELAPPCLIDRADLRAVVQAVRVGEAGAAAGVERDRILGGNPGTWNPGTWNPGTWNPGMESGDIILGIRGHLITSM